MHIALGLSEPASQLLQLFFRLGTRGALPIDLTKGSML